MSSRFATSPHIDFCFKPVRISKNGLIMYVPCGKCNGCLLQKANSMSFRLGDEIENRSHSIFCTFTYDNRHLPKIRSRVEDGAFHWYNAPEDLRVVPVIRDGKVKEVREVLRDSVDFYSKYNLFAPPKNWHDEDCIGYLSKRDIQLYLKNLRKLVYDHFNISRGSLSYYVIGEYGPGKDKNQGKFRPHYHAIFFPYNEEIADFLLGYGLFACWQMCDKGLFEQYAKYCDSGTRHYVTEYVTGTTYLPPLLSGEKEIKPFALMSRQNGAIGVSTFDRKKVSQDIERGIDTYTKRISRIERNYIFQYSPKITGSLFPKCSRYNLLSFDGLLRIYGYLYEIRQIGYRVATLFNEFSDFSAQDYKASRACLKVCDMNGWTPYHYVEVLVDFYNRKAIKALRYQYELQQSNINNPYWCIGWYNNYEAFLKYDLDYRHELLPVGAARHYDSCRWFLASFGLDSVDLDMVKESVDQSSYEHEVDSIIFDADKSKKVNSLVGQSPHIV